MGSEGSERSFLCLSVYVEVSERLLGFRRRENKGRGKGGPISGRLLRTLTVQYGLTHPTQRPILRGAMFSS